jgi:hypothetical protein
MLEDLDSEVKSSSEGFSNSANVSSTSQDKDTPAVPILSVTLPSCEKKSPNMEEGSEVDIEKLEGLCSEANDASERFSNSVVEGEAAESDSDHSDQELDHAQETHQASRSNSPSLDLPILCQPQAPAAFGILNSAVVESEKPKRSGQTLNVSLAVKP